MGIQLSLEELAGPGLLEQITEGSGGHLFPVSDVNRLPDIAARIGVELHNQYLLAYSPSAMQHDGRHHRVRVQVVPPAGISALHGRLARRLPSTDSISSVIHLLSRALAITACPSDNPPSLEGTSHGKNTVKPERSNTVDVSSSSRMFWKAAAAQAYNPDAVACAHRPARGVDGPRQGAVEFRGNRRDGLTVSRGGRYVSKRLAEVDFIIAHIESKASVIGCGGARRSFQFHRWPRPHNGFRSRCPEWLTLRRTAGHRRR